MSEQYLFIIWNKALFCKNKILNDLSESFKIDKYFYIQWSKELFANNIKAFYGIKTNNIEEKIKHVGNGKFLLIIVSDPNPIYDLRKTYNGQEKVNIKIYDKKHLYRKWTGGQFRVHSSQDELETKHDLTILFGIKYNELIYKLQNNSTKTIDTIGAYGFPTFNDLSETLSNINNSFAYILNDRIIILTKCRKDIESILFRDYVSISNTIYSLRIYGEKDGDLPMTFFDKFNDEMVNDFLAVEDIYYCYQKENISPTKELNDFFNKYGFNKDLYPVDTNRPDTNTSSIKKIKNFIRYAINRIKYNNLFNKLKF